MVEEALLLRSRSGLHVELCVDAAVMAVGGWRTGVYWETAVLLHSEGSGGESPGLLMNDRLGCCLYLRDAYQDVEMSAIQVGFADRDCASAKVLEDVFGGTGQKGRALAGQEVADADDTLLSMGACCWFAPSSGGRSSTDALMEAVDEARPRLWDGTGTLMARWRPGVQ